VYRSVAAASTINDPDVGLRRRDLRYGRQRGSTRCQMREFAAGKFHGVSLNCLREGFRDALSLAVLTDGSPGTSNFESDFRHSTAPPALGEGRRKRTINGIHESAIQ
jgi:hypothetical protein